MKVKCIVAKTVEVEIDDKFKELDQFWGAEVVADEEQYEELQKAVETAVGGKLFDGIFLTDVDEDNVILAVESVETNHLMLECC